MVITHKIFLSWLLYVTIVAFSAIILFISGMPQTVLGADHSHMSAALLGVYVIAELLAGTQAVSISRQHRQLTDCIRWLRVNRLNHVADIDGSIHLISSHSEQFVLGRTPFADHVRSIMDRADNSDPHQRINQRILLDTFTDSLHHRASIGEFVASRIVWIGILATVAGVIMAFWPFLQVGTNIDGMKAHLGTFFAGIAVAFIPTALSFVFKIVLDVNARILSSGVNDVSELATVVSESFIVPHLELRGRAGSLR